MGRDAHRADAERPCLPRGARRRGDGHNARGVHADGDEKVLSGMLVKRSGTHRILDYQRVYVKGPRHGCSGLCSSMREMLSLL